MGAQAFIAGPIGKSLQVILLNFDPNLLAIILVERLGLHKTFKHEPRLGHTVVTVAFHIGDRCSLHFDPTISVRDVSFDISEQLIARAEFVLFFDQIFAQARPRIRVGFYPKPFPEMPTVFPRDKAVHCRAPTSAAPRFLYID